MHHGQGQWNGVAILSRVGIDDVTTGFDDGARRPLRGRRPAARGHVRRRARRVSVYVPNGREVGTEFYDRKLVWLDALHDWLAATQSPDDEIVVLGDFNVAPEDRDVWSPKAFKGSTHVTAPERAAVRAPVRVGPGRRVPRAVRRRASCSATGTTGAATSTSTAGCASTCVLATQPLAAASRWAVVDRNARKGKQPSDHAPVIIDFDDRS